MLTSWKKLSYCNSNRKDLVEGETRSEFDVEGGHSGTVTSAGFRMLNMVIK